MFKYNHHSRHLGVMKVLNSCTEQFYSLRIEVLYKLYEAQHGTIHQQDHVPFSCQINK